MFLNMKIYVRICEPRMTVVNYTDLWVYVTDFYLYIFYYVEYAVFLTLVQNK